MSTSRRNYYRILHVQPDAPLEVITASHRALMATCHLNKGTSDPATLNEALDVLVDAERRKAYDAERESRAARASAMNHPAGAESAAPAGDATAGTGAAPKACSVCQQPAPESVQADTLCSRCGAPLTPATYGLTKSRVNERRALPRIMKSDWVKLYAHWPSEEHIMDVRMRDVSLDGISVYSGAPLPVQSRVRVLGSAFDIVAQLVSVRRVGKVFTLHAQLLTLRRVAKIDDGTYVEPLQDQTPGGADANQALGRLVGRR
jgi:hypothetical protein